MSLFLCHLFGTRLLYLHLRIYVEVRATLSIEVNRANLLSLGAEFADFRVVVYESHSTDATRSLRAAPRLCSASEGEQFRGSELGSCTKSTRVVRVRAKIPNFDLQTI